MIHFNGVSKIYNHNAVVLDDVTFKIEPGEFVAIVGPSGAGKSTIIKMAIGEERPTKGRVLLANGKRTYEVNKLRSHELPTLRRHVGIIFQDFRLLPTKTAHENVAFAMEVEGKSQDEIFELVPQMLDMVGLSEKKHQFPKELSGGEKQRVAIARAMINRPAMIFADEPTGNLDPLNELEIIKLLLKINELGTTVVLATHSKNIVDAIRRRVISISEGRIVRDDPEGRYVL